MSRLQDFLTAWLAGQTEPPVTKLVGIRLVEVGDGIARLELKTGQQHYNPMGIVHGGILCDLADAAMGVAMASSLPDGEAFSTIELTIRYFRPVQESTLIAAGKVAHRSRNLGYIECEISDEQGRLVAKAASTCMIQAISSGGSA